MQKIIYSARFKREEVWQDDSPIEWKVVSKKQTEALVQSIKTISMECAQDVDVLMEGDIMKISFYLTDHDYWGRLKEDLVQLFLFASRIDFSLGSLDVLIDFYYKIAKDAK